MASSYNELTIEGFLNKHLYHPDPPSMSLSRDQVRGVCYVPSLLEHGSVEEAKAMLCIVFFLDTENKPYDVEIDMALDILKFLRAKAVSAKDLLDEHALERIVYSGCSGSRGVMFHPEILQSMYTMSDAPRLFKKIVDELRHSAELAPESYPENVDTLENIGSVRELKNICDAVSSDDDLRTILKDMPGEVLLKNTLYDLGNGDDFPLLQRIARCLPVK